MLCFARESKGRPRSHTPGDEELFLRLWMNPQYLKTVLPGQMGWGALRELAFPWFYEKVNDVALESPLLWIIPSYIIP